MSEYYNIIEEIKVDIESFISPAVWLNNNSTLGNFFASVKKIEYKIDRLRSSIEQNIQNSIPLINFLENNLTLQSFLYIECPYIVHDIQQIQEQLPRINDITLDFNNEAMWTKPRCQLLKNWLSRGDVYEAMENDFRSKRTTFRENITFIAKLIDDHVECNGLIAPHINDQVIKKELIDFSFVNNSILKERLRKDYIEIKKSLQNDNWKAAVILCGSSIEALLYDCLSHFEKEIESYIPSGRKIDELKLEQLINIARRCGFITIGVERFGHSLRDYRNLVHSIKELKRDYKIEGPEARACVEVLNMVIRDIKKKINSAANNDI